MVPAPTGTIHLRSGELGDLECVCWGGGDKNLGKVEGGEHMLLDLIHFLDFYFFPHSP